MDPVTTTIADPKIATTTTTTTAPDSKAATATSPVTTTATTAPSASTGTIADPATPATTAPGAWPEDWRTRYAKGDEKRAKIFERYTSPEAVADALVAAQAKISSGDLKRPLPENATPEQIAEYRRDNGIPEKAEGYLDNLPKTVVLDETGKALATDFLKAMHDKNLPPATAHAALEWYTGFTQRRDEAQVKSDKQNWEKAENVLREEWGPEYTGNKNALTALLATLPGGEETANLILTARGADGTKIGGNPQILRGLVQLAKQVNPAATIVPGDSSTALKRIDDRLAEIRTMRQTDERSYFNNDRVLKEERELLAYKDRMSGSKAA